MSFACTRLARRFAYPRVYNEICLICKTPLKSRALCDHCEHELLRLREPIVRKEAGFKTRSLFAWKNPGPRALGMLVKSLKHLERPILWRELSVWMINRFGPLHGAVLVPIPSLKRNHALAFAG